MGRRKSCPGEKPAVPAAALSKDQLSLVGSYMHSQPLAASLCLRHFPGAAGWVWLSTIAPPRQWAPLLGGNHGGLPGEAQEGPSGWAEGRWDNSLKCPARAPPKGPGFLLD